jgi:hypothetical protein
MIVLLSIAVGGCTSASDESSTSDDELRATKTLLCASSANESISGNRKSQVLLEANVSRDGVLANAVLSMPADDALGVRNETLTAQKKYAPRSALFTGMQKYTSADASCGYAVIAPTNLNGQTGTFSVYVQQACDHFFSTATLNCKVESKKPVVPDPPGAAAGLELRFTSQGKATAVDDGYYEATDFTGNKIVVASAQTSIDIEYLVPDDSESAPDDMLCYTGDATQAKKILWTMLANTDGNGDHWLDEGATITGSTGQTLEADWSVTGEGGSTPRALSVPVCP